MAKLCNHLRHCVLSVLHQRRWIECNEDQEDTVEKKIGQVEVFSVRIPFHLQIFLAQRMCEQFDAVVLYHSLFEWKSFLWTSEEKGCQLDVRINTEKPSIVNRKKKSYLLQTQPWIFMTWTSLVWGHLRSFMQRSYMKIKLKLFNKQLKPRRNDIKICCLLLNTKCLYFFIESSL